MAKDNVKRFYDLVSGSEELQKELQKRDAEYAGTHGLPSDDASDEEKAEFRLAAVKDIVLPLAEEHGLDFTVDEMIEYEKDILDDEEGELDRSELRNVAGGIGTLLCFYAGVGIGSSESGSGCFILGAGTAACFKRGK